MIYNRHKNESIKKYQIRLCKNKSDYGLSFEKISDLMKTQTGNVKSEGYYRRWWNGYDDGYNDCSENSTTDDVLLKELEAKRILLEKEKIKFYDYRTAYNKEIRESARKEEVYDILLEKLSDIKPYETSYVEVKKSNNDLFVGLNDIHFGACINNYWNKYDSDIAYKRLQKYLFEILEIAKLHKSENCYVCANGDLISGSIHKTIQISNKENIIEQVKGVSELIAWFLSELANKFKMLYFYNVAGNHSRLSTKEDSPKDERLDDLIPWYLTARLSNFNNIVFGGNNIDSTLNIVNIRNKNYLNIHGDLDSFNNIIRLIEMLDEEIYAVHFGHKHHNATDYVQQYKVIMSGSLQGVDDYCIEKRIYGRAQQLVAVCTDDGIKCTYDVDLQEVI